MNIFITNDDGIDAPGLRELIDCVSQFGNITAVAPEMQHSGQSSAITVNEALRIRRCDDYHGEAMYAVNGTPVDCVKLGFHALYGENSRPDLLLSGINHGSNSGTSIIYSGTMGAVLEGCMLGIPSIGFSFHCHRLCADMGVCREVVRKVTAAVAANGLPHHICLNVNIPNCDKINGIKVTRAALGHWTDEYREYTDPHGKTFYWLTGRYVNEEEGNPETDLYWSDRGYATIVPCRPDQSSAAAIDDIRSMILKE